MEEALGRRTPEEALRNILALQERLDADGLRFSFFEDSWFPAGSKITTPTWKIMAKLVRKVLHHADNWQEAREADSYIRHHLGRSSGETLLLELLPLPAPRIADWPDAYMERFQNWSDYEQHVLTKRAVTIRDLVQKHHPQAVICYGRHYWRHYRDIFNLGSASEDTVGHNTRILVAQYERTIIALTPFFDYRYFPHMAIGEVGSRILARLESHET